ncbi:TPA: fimbrial protein [Photobacterium damselae]
MNKFISVLLLSLFSGSLYAANLSGDITNGGLKWNNATTGSSNTVMPHGWITLSPDTVVAWQPAIPSSLANKLTLTLQGATAATVEVNVAVKGIEYAHTSTTEATPFFTGSATKAGNTFTLGSGAGQSAAFYSKTLTHLNSQTPFTAYRPIIELGDIVAAMKNKPNGVYQGVIQLSLPFVYRRNADELITQRSFGFSLPVQIINNSVTCDVPPAFKVQEIDFGIIGADRLLDGTANQKVVPFGLVCNNPLTFGGITFVGTDANITGKEVIQAVVDGSNPSESIGMGIQLTPKGTFNRVVLNQEINFSEMFADGTTNFDLSFYARPVATKPVIENKKFRASVRLTLRYF